MSSSGVGVQPEFNRAFDSLKGFSLNQANPKLKYIILGLGPGNKEIVIKKTVPEQDNPSYEDFINEFPAKEPRWGLYDFDFQLPAGGKRKKLCLFSWAPDDANVFQKMVFASSNGTFANQLSGIQFKHQCNDYEDVAYEKILEMVSKGN